MGLSPVCDGDNFSIFEKKSNINFFTHHDFREFALYEINTPLKIRMTNFSFNWWNVMMQHPASIAQKWVGSGYGARRGGALGQGEGVEEADIFLDYRRSLRWYVLKEYQA